MEIVYQKEKRRFLVKPPLVGWFFVTITGPQSCKVTAINEVCHNYDMPAVKMAWHILKHGCTPEHPEQQKLWVEHLEQANRRYREERQWEYRVTGRIGGIHPTSSRWEEMLEEVFGHDE